MLEAEMKVKEMTTEQKKELLKTLLAKKLGSNGGSKPKLIKVASGLTDSTQYTDFLEQKKFMSSVGGEDVYFNVVEGLSKNTVEINSNEMVNFAGYNYLGMSGDKRVSYAAKEAIDKYGTSASASRIASGEKPLHRELEQAIAGFLDTRDCVVFVSGFGTNETVLGHIAGPNDLILYDSLIHESVQRGSMLSGARMKPFPHNRWQSVDHILTEMRTKYEKVIIVIEGVYSVDGDIPDLIKFIETKKKHKAMLMVDEAHSIGTIGATGRGIGEYYNVNREDVDLWMGTLSKSFASCGGYIAGSKEIVEYLKYTTPGFVFSVALTPSDTAAALQSLKILIKEPEKVLLLQKQSRMFLEAAKAKGFNTGSSSDSSVIPLILGNSMKCLKLYHTLFEKGIFVIPMLYPTVPDNAARLRFFINNTHTEEQINYTIDSIEKGLSEIG